MPIHRSNNFNSIDKKSIPAGLDRRVLEKSEQISEEELIRRCRAAETDAFQLLFSRYGDMMQIIAARMASDRQTRNDIFQESAKCAILRFKTFERRSSLSTWLYSITVNTALKLLRKEKRYTPLEISQASCSSQDYDTEFLAVAI
ncbi:MAG: RNA polymerase sigma factor [Chitinispirillaceae bacterium]